MRQVDVEYNWFSDGPRLCRAAPGQISGSGSCLVLLRTRLCGLQEGYTGDPAQHALVKASKQESQEVATVLCATK
jgi:hypothetical protein